MLNIVGLTVRIGTSKKTSHSILREVSFTVANGEAVGLVGESGSGKSMTLRSIIGIEPPDASVSGSITFDNIDVRTLSVEALRRFRADKVAMIAQNPHAVLNPCLPVERYLIEGLHDAQGGSVEWAKSRASELLEQVGIENADRVCKRYPHQLSGGMLQRVVIAGAIAGEPSLMLADEPTTALDVTTQAEVMAILDEARRNRKMSMLFVTHDLDLAGAVCDWIVVMKNGEIVETGTTKQLYEAPSHPYTRALMAARPPSISCKITNFEGAL